MAEIERSAEAKQAITEIRSHLRRISRYAHELDWFDTCYSSNDEENIPLLLEKVKQADEILQEALKL